jgi:hypothetical protein
MIIIWTRPEYKSRRYVREAWQYTGSRSRIIGRGDEDRIIVAYEVLTKDAHPNRISPNYWLRRYWYLSPWDEQTEYLPCEAMTWNETTQTFNKPVEI